MVRIQKVTQAKCGWVKDRTTKRKGEEIGGPCLFLQWDHSVVRSTHLGLFDLFFPLLENSGKEKPIFLLQKKLPDVLVNLSYAVQYRKVPPRGSPTHPNNVSQLSVVVEAQMASPLYRLKNVS